MVGAPDDVREIEASLERRIIWLLASWRASPPPERFGFAVRLSSVPEIPRGRKSPIGFLRSG